MKQVSNDSSLAGLMKETQSMKSTISNLTLTNQQLTKNNSRQQIGTSNRDINPSCCAHWSHNWANKKKGHKDNSTSRNRMNGSDPNCF